MDFDDYQEKSEKTARYPKDINFGYLLLKLAGETGELCEKFGKLVRDKDVRFTIFYEDIRGEETEKSEWYKDPEFKGDVEKIKLELGDILWYISQICTELELKFNEVALSNLDKLQSRLDRDKIKGSGDNR